MLIGRIISRLGSTSNIWSLIDFCVITFEVHILVLVKLQPSIFSMIFKVGNFGTGFYVMPYNKHLCYEDLYLKILREEVQQTCWLRMSSWWTPISTYTLTLFEIFASQSLSSLLMYSNVKKSTFVHTKMEKANSRKSHVKIFCRTFIPCCSPHEDSCKIPNTMTHSSIVFLSTFE